MEDISFKNPEGEQLKGKLSASEGSNTCFIICHGFLASKDKRLIQEISATLESAGQDTFRFDFSGCGESKGETGNSSYVKQQEDLRSAIKQLKSRGFVKFGLVGHSMGGSVSILVSEDNKDIRWLIDIAAPAYPTRIKERRFKDQLGHLKRYGKMVLEHPKLGDMVFYRKFFDDLEKVDIPDAIKNIRASLLIVHGTKDTAVDLEESEELFMHAPNPKTMQILSGADHNFRNGKSRDELLSTINNWVRKWTRSR